MPIYSCSYCNFSSKIKSHYQRHLTTNKHEKNYKEYTLMNPNEPKMNQNEPKMNQNEPVKIKKIKKFKCSKCDETFNTHASKRRHELHRCKEMVEINKIIKDKNKQIEKLEKKVDKLTDKIGNTTNIQNNNIIINSYGKEDLSHITDKIKDQLLKIPYCSIPKLIETIHFNDDMPQNKNIKYPNKKENILSVYEGDKWVYKDKNKTINDLIDSKYNVLDDHFDSTNSELPNFVKHSYSSFKKVYEEGDEDFVKNLKKECDMVLLNNRK